MSLMSYVLIPIGVVVLFWLFGLVVGRPMRRRTFDTVLALLLLVYFLITAGLGIFWVARQELPVFDWHYVFGYVTLALVILHVVLNWQAISAFFLRLSPGILATDGGRAWRPALKYVGWAFALVLYGGAAYWIGHSQTPTEITVTMKEPLAAAPVGSAPAPAGSEAPTGDSDNAVEASVVSPASQYSIEDDLPLPAPASVQMVEHEGEQRMLADYYHEMGKHAPTKMAGGGLTLARRPEVFKAHPGAATVELPRPRGQSNIPVGEAIETCRYTVRGFLPESITLEDLSTLLFMTNGITSTVRLPGRDYHLRAAPSAGALYPTVTYVLARNVDGLPPGLYHYGVDGHRLHRLRAGEGVSEELAAAVPQGHLVERAAATFIYTSIYFRSSFKYGDRAYRYCCMDAGHLAVQTMLTAAALGYGSTPIGRFDDGKVNALLQVNEGEEGALLIVPVGILSEEAPAQSGELSFVLQPEMSAGETEPLILLIHGHTRLRVGAGRVQSFPAHPPENKAYTEVPVIRLPSDLPEGDDLIPTIERRRSVRDWANYGMTIEEFSSILHYAFGMDLGDGTSLFDPSVEGNHALNLYVLVNDVKDVDAGVYYYRRRDHALSEVRKGDYRRQAYFASLSQEVVGNAGAVFIMTIDLQRVGYSDGDRGYRYAAIDAGMLGGRVYLQATGLKLGCCGVGAFFDDHVSSLIQVDPRQELVIYMAAVGVKEPYPEAP
jgi:SagB-type dehydrogenase family enzyme